MEYPDRGYGVNNVTSGLKDIFYQGDHQQVLSLSWDSPHRRWKIADLTYILASLSFLGRCEEAQSLFTSAEKRLSRDQTIASRFFLGLGFTRKGDYVRARLHFARNRREKGRISYESRFYIYQGLSFYRYYCGKWRLALRDAERSFEAALRSHFLYGRVLSADLRGHLLVQMGQVARGLRVLREAQSLAEQMGNREAIKAIEISRVTYEAQFGLAPHETVARLQKYLESASRLQDTYSHSHLLLELARQYSLRGCFLEASQILDQAAQQIYSHQNRRQEVTLNLSYAYLSYISGDPARGLSFIQAAKRTMAGSVDHVLHLAALGLEQQSVGTLGMSDKQMELRIRLRQDSQVYGGMVNRRILARWQLNSSLATSPSQDPLGDIKDLLSSKPSEAIVPILQSGYLTFLLDLFPQFRGRQVLGLDLDQASLLTFGRHGVERHEGLTKLLRSVLHQLAQGPATKAHLIQAVWNIRSYHPLNHDALIYQAITALRKLLGSRAEWIETTEDGYQLRRDVELFSFAKLKPINNRVELIRAKIDRVGPQYQLNHRQIQFLREAKTKEFINVGEYKKLFCVSEITASRDLSMLHKYGLVVRIGKARATCYARTEELS